eukprot:TRINITY_DN25367_c0_g1_i1.p1 TRINITY_DN25367_c0_g1~~TRINITY_DN25367_c0_g1_i1.p1  ORF type:complete len:321 (+),score=55.51 TRINITY_DN25367_c0_g1_i1:130-1092(+)
MASPAQLRRRIHAMYAEYNPGKLAMLPEMLQEAVGHEEDVLSALVEMYGPEPDGDAPARNASAHSMRSRQRSESPSEPRGFFSRGSSMRSGAPRGGGGNIVRLSSCNISYHPQASRISVASPTASHMNSPLNPHLAGGSQRALPEKTERPRRHVTPSTFRRRAVAALGAAAARSLLRQAYTRWRAWCAFVVPSHARTLLAGQHPPPERRGETGPPSPRLHLHGPCGLVTDGGAVEVAQQGHPTHQGDLVRSLNFSPPRLDDLVYAQKQAMNVMVAPVYDAQDAHAPSAIAPWPGAPPPRLSHAAKQRIIGDLLGQLRHAR